MEKGTRLRFIALLEKCFVTEAGLRHLINTASDNQYTLYVFRNVQQFTESLRSRKYQTVIYSLTGSRESRRESLLLLRELAAFYPGMQRIILANDESELRLIGHLSPAPLHGVLNKALPLLELSDRLGAHLKGAGIAVNPEEDGRCAAHLYALSPTERAILRDMSCGYSLPEIAVRLARNIKTIRAHKFNAMVKLGVNSDIGLLSAADLLPSLPGWERIRPSSRH